MRRPRNRHTDTHTAPAPLPAVPDGLSTRQRRIVNAVRTHGTCLVVPADDYGWVVLYVPDTDSVTGASAYRPLCRVPLSRVKATIRTGSVAIGATPAAGVDMPGLPDRYYGPALVLG